MGRGTDCKRAAGEARSARVATHGSKYLPKSSATGGNPRRDQRCATFLKNHADAIIACDFCVAATATFRILYVFVLMEHASRRIIHLNVTSHPTAAWTLQQLREAIPSDHRYRFIIHDHDAIFSMDSMILWPVSALKS